MDKIVENFILSNKKAPDWFNKEANAGRVKLLFNEDEEMIGAQIVSGTRTYEAKIGDTILNTKYGLMVLPKEKAKQYGVQKKDDKQDKEIKEEKKEAEEQL